MWNSSQSLDIEMHAWNLFLHELISGKWKQLAVNRGKFLFKVWNSLHNQEQLSEVICQPLTMLHYNKWIWHREWVKLYLTWPAASNIKEIMISKKRIMISRMRTWSLSPAEPQIVGYWVPMFCRKGSLQKIGNIICLSLNHQNPAAFPPVTCPLCCCYHHSPHLWPSNTGLPPCPLFLLSLPLRGEPGECFVSGFQLASVQVLERWLNRIVFSSFIWRSCKMQMGFLVSSCICWDMCFSCAFS